MKLSDVFVPKNTRTLATFVGANPLAQVVSWDDGNVEATPLPVIAEHGSNREITKLVGHFAKANPHVALLGKSPRALCIFHGAHGYVSPSWMRDRTQAPTWNFETVHFLVEIELAKREEDTAQAIEILLAHMEAGRTNPWRSQELADRYSRLLKAVIGFRATVLDTRVKFKLGQNERDDVYADILTGLVATGNTRLADAMRRANARRTPLTTLSEERSRDT